MKRFFHAAYTALLLASAAAGCDNPSAPPVHREPGGNWPPASTTPFKADLDRDTYLAGIAQYGDVVYVIGGADTNWKASAKVRAFDLKTRTWSMRTPMIKGRYYPALLVTGDRIDAIGGRDDSTHTVPEQNRYESYGISSDTWTAHEPIAEKGFDGSYGTYMTVLDGKVYSAMTGSSHDGASDTAIALVVIAGESVTRTSSAPLRRLVEPTVVAAEGKIYVFGRTSSTEKGVTRMYVYDPATDRFVEKAPPRHNERGYANCCYYHGGRIFKLNTYEKSANVMEIYTIATDTWSEIPLPYPMRNNAFFHPIVTDRSTGEVYFCSVPFVTLGFHFNPQTLKFSTR